MTELTEAELAIAVKLIDAWYGPLLDEGHEAALGDPVCALALVQTARTLVTAELAARAVPDEAPMVEAIARVLAHEYGLDPDNFDISLICDSANNPLPLWQYYAPEAQSALSAIRPVLAAAQARAERAEAERDVMREALQRLAKLGNEPYFGNSDGNMIARAALEQKP